MKKYRRYDPDPHGTAASPPCTCEMAVQSLLDAGRTVHEIEAEPWQGYSSGYEARQARRHAG